MNTFKSKPNKTKESAHALDLLEEFISQLTAKPSHWFLVNSPGDNDYDLRHLLGMTDNEYKAFFLSAGLFKRDGRCQQNGQNRHKPWDYFRSIDIAHPKFSETCSIFEFKLFRSFWSSHKKWNTFH